MQTSGLHEKDAGISARYEVDGESGLHEKQGSGPEGLVIDGEVPRSYTAHELPG